MSIHWLKQAYLTCIPAYPIGYLIVHGFRGDEFWTSVYVKRSRFPPSDHLKEIVDEELDTLDYIRHRNITLSLTDDMDPKVYGGFFLRQGTELQFPLRCSFIDVEHARRMGANLEIDLGLPKNRRKLEVNSEVSDELISRMMLSDQAKRFLVQRQLQIANSGILFCAPMLGWFSIFSFGYAIMSGVTSLAGPIVGFLSASTVSLLAFSHLMTSFRAYYVTKADEMAVMRGDEYIEGARDFFSQSVKLNRLLRKIMGQDGAALIRKNGDCKSDSVPYTARLQAIENYVKRRRKEGNTC